MPVHLAHVLWAALKRKQHLLDKDKPEAALLEAAREEVALARYALPLGTRWAALAGTALVAVGVVVLARARQGSNG